MLPINDIREVYAAIGDKGFRTLVDAFYRRVEADPLLRPMFPPDLSNGKERQYLFLRQVFGGPGEYSERHGHPRLGMRHLPFAITREARDAWVGHMLAAIDEVAIPEPQATVLRTYFERFSLDLINRRSEGETAPNPMRPVRTELPEKRLEIVDS